MRENLTNIIKNSLPETWERICLYDPVDLVEVLGQIRSVNSELKVNTTQLRQFFDSQGVTMVNAWGVPQNVNTQASQKA